MATLRRDDTQATWPIEAWQELKRLNHAVSKTSKASLDPKTRTFRVTEGETTFWLELGNLSGLRWPTSQHFDTMAKVSTITIMNRLGNARGITVTDPDLGQQRSLELGDEIVVRHRYGQYQFRLVPKLSRRRRR